MLNKFELTTRDIPSAWFEMIDNIFDHGRVVTVEHGSYQGQQRLEFDFAQVHIKFPGNRPLIPEIPPHLQSQIQLPCDMEYIENEYLAYMMENAPLKKNELYSYGSRIRPQMDAIIERYKKNGYGSNQECISISQPSDIDLSDPPCLRSCDIRIFPKSALHPNETQALHFYVYFRSWDLFNGFPANLAAIRLMQEFMASCIDVEAGEIIAMSKGLHIYDHVWNHAKLLVSRA